MKRDWSVAWAKVEAEGRCRVCRHHRAEADEGELDPAHIIPRSLGGSPSPVVQALEIVPLCRSHHRQYDEYALDLLPHLTKEEQAAAVLRVGMMTALKIITGDPSPITPNRGWAA